MTLITLEEAEQDLVESVAYYEARQPGLGERLRDEVAATVEWIVRQPEVPRLRRKKYRRVNGEPTAAPNDDERDHVAVPTRASLARSSSSVSLA